MADTPATPSAAASPSAAGAAAAAAPPVSPLKFLEDARAAALAEIDEHVATLRGNGEGKEAAATALRKLSTGHDRNREAIVAAGGIAPLVDLARSGGDGATAQAAALLSSLALLSDDNKSAIVAAGAVAPLVELARAGSAGAKENAALALKNLCPNSDANRKAVVEAGAVDPLVELLKSGHTGAKERAAGALWNLSIANPANRAAIAAAGAVEPLVALMKDGNAAAQWTASGQAAGALKNLAADKDVAAQIVEVGGLMALEELARTDALKSDELYGYARRVAREALERVAPNVYAPPKVAAPAPKKAAAPPPPPKEKVKKSGVAIGLDIDEGSGLSMAEQLGMAMRKNGARVMDLFREWDTDGDGEVSRKEFHKAMPMLGFEATKKDINELFDSWDKDGGGSLDFRELQKILKAPPPKEKVQKATGKLKAVAALTKAGAGRGAKPKK